MNTEQNKTPLTMEQAAAFTGYSRAYLYKLVYSGKIPAYKPEPTAHGKVIFCKEELTEWLFRNKRQSTQELNRQADEKLSGVRK
jgi:excisionase family DNA binding protein